MSNSPYVALVIENQAKFFYSSYITVHKLRSCLGTHKALSHANVWEIGGIFHSFLTSITEASSHIYTQYALSPAVELQLRIGYETLLYPSHSGRGNIKICYHCQEWNLSHRPRDVVTVLTEVFYPATHKNCSSQICYFNLRLINV